MPLVLKWDLIEVPEKEVIYVGSVEGMRREVGVKNAGKGESGRPTIAILTTELMDMLLLSGHERMTIG